MSEDSDSSEDTWCKGTKSKSEILSHFQKAKNPPEKWQEENRKLLKQDED
jgi:hypothetical protein